MFATNELKNKLGVKLPEVFLGGILKEVVDPDRVPDESSRRRCVPHHNPPNSIIEYYFNLAFII